MITLSYSNIISDHSIRLIEHSFSNKLFYLQVPKPDHIAFAVSTLKNLDHPLSDRFVDFFRIGGNFVASESSTKALSLSSSRQDLGKVGFFRRSQEEGTWIETHADLEDLSEGILFKKFFF